MTFMKYLTLFLLLFTKFNYLYSQTEPSSQPTSLQFVGVKAYGLSLTFTSSDASKYLVLRSTNPITAVPTDNVFYDVGDLLGNAKVLASGNKKSLYKVRDALINTKYYFAIFGYNVSGNNSNYKTNNPLVGNHSTLDTDVGTYYDNYRIDTEDAIDDLSDLLYNHYHLDYGDFYSKVVSNVYQKDTVGGMHYVICDYSNTVYQFSGNNYSNSVFNREHVTPKSWMPSDPNSYTFEGSDYHNLFPVKASVNTKRSNLPVGEVVNQTWSDIDSKFGKDQYNQNVFEPKESKKGDVARAMFYQIVTYDGLIGSWAFNNLETYGDNQDVDLLLQWHLQDTVSDFEKTRNEYIYSQQGNRNPFIDFPEWVNCFDFKTLTLTGNCPLDTNANPLPNDINRLLYEKECIVFPNIIVDNAYAKLLNQEYIQKIELLNINGKSVKIPYSINSEIVDFNLANITKGIYFLKLYTSSTIYVKKIQKK